MLIYPLWASLRVKQISWDSVTQEKAGPAAPVCGLYVNWAENSNKKTGRKEKGEKESAIFFLTLPSAIICFFFLLATIGADLSIVFLISHASGKLSMG